MNTIILRYSLFGIAAGGEYEYFNMIINILRYSLFGIAGGQEVDHNFC